jgi:type II secretory ATPase GspE/PulE/Tfp pilus assembly ATPase PilB-like protein
MGVEPFLLASSVLMTQAQRLYRRLCPACRKARALPQEVLELHHIDPALFDGVTLYAAQGCPKCSGVGYRGRGALMEILVVDDYIRALILKETSAGELAERAIASGMQTLRDVGLRRVREGVTSLEEILRVTGRD